MTWAWLQQAKAKAREAREESLLTPQQIVSEMMATIMSNQNTLKYGLVSPDGKWRDDQGKTLEDYGATASGKFRGLSGFIAFAKTI